MPKFSAARFAQTEEFYRAAYDVTRPEGLILHVNPYSKTDAQKLAKKFTKNGDTDWHAVGNEAAQRGIKRTCEGCTSAELGRVSPLRYPAAKVEEMEAALKDENVEEFQMDDELLRELLEHAPGFAGRVGQLVMGNDQLSEAVEAVRKNDSVSSSGTKTSAET